MKTIYTNTHTHSGFLSTHVKIPSKTCSHQLIFEVQQDLSDFSQLFICEDIFRTSKPTHTDTHRLRFLTQLQETGDSVNYYKFFFLPSLITEPILENCTVITFLMLLICFYFVLSLAYCCRLVFLFFFFFW